MKTLLSKIISLAAVAAVLIAGFSAVPKPIPESDGTNPYIKTEIDSGEDENDGKKGNEASPLFDDTDEIICQ